ncbi:MAG: hypothetical protein HWN68_02320 [Desulfobacterales bacterium]|nr:hypothetical protein [Desulfobacterales bacterium]
MSDFQEHAKGKLTWKLEKFKAKDGKEIKEKDIEPYETVEKESMCLLNEGIGELIDLICGLGTPTKWDEANTRIGVGDDATAPVATQTGLLGTNKLYKGMNTGYPQKSAQNSVFQSDFVDGEAEWAWLEETIVNAADDTGKNLCRQNTNLGTKPTGQTWRLTGTITWS